MLNLWDKDSNITNGIIAHESIHAADFIFNIRGIKHDYDNPESYTYFCEWIVDRVYECIIKNNLKHKIKGSV